MKKYQFVVIRGKDHSVQTEGQAVILPVEWIGILYKETPEEYRLVHMLFCGSMKNRNNVTTAIVKHPGMKKTILGYMVLK